MGLGLKFLTATRYGAGSILRLIIKNWYWLIFLVIIIPVVASSISTAVETQNIFHPAVELGLHMTNADALIYENVQILKTDPSLLIGVTKPTGGIWNNFVYYWNLFKLIWVFLGLIWLITFPFVIAYRIVKLRNVSEVSKNVTRALVIGFIFIFIVNLVLALYNVTTESVIYEYPEGTTQMKKFGLIALTTIPFHGLFALIQYLIMLGI